MSTYCVFQTQRPGWAQRVLRHSLYGQRNRTSSFGCPCRITVTFYDEKDKSETTVRVPLGENLLEAAHANNVDLEGQIALVSFRSAAAKTAQLAYVHAHDISCLSPGRTPTCHDLCAGACEGSLACSTCHVVIEVCNLSAPMSTFKFSSPGDFACMTL
jgi:ferredoxin